MQFPIFNSSRSVYALPGAERVDLDTLGQIIKYEPRLRELTEGVRAGDAQSKRKLGTTCLGGPYQGLPPDADHGRCIHQWHNPAACNVGYRNTQHIDVKARNGIILIDIDNMTVDPQAVQFMLGGCADAVVVAWVSARGRGLKIGVSVNPIPLDTPSNYDAWAAGYHYITSILAKAGLVVGEHYKIDGTYSMAHVAILVHDGNALVRPVGRGSHAHGVAAPCSDGVPWVPGERSTAPRPLRMGVSGQRGLPEGTIPEGYLTLLMNSAADPLQLVELFPWSEGYRSSSMFLYGGRCALRGFDYERGRAVAIAQAYLTDMAAEYGIEESLRHYDRGYRSSAEQLMDWTVMSDIT